jgi:hypothetical protein
MPRGGDDEMDAKPFRDGDLCGGVIGMQRRYTGTGDSVSFDVFLALCISRAWKV